MFPESIPGCRCASHIQDICTLLVRSYKIGIWLMFLHRKKALRGLHEARLWTAEFNEDKVATRISKLSVCLCKISFLGVCSRQWCPCSTERLSPSQVLIRSARAPRAVTLTTRPLPWLDIIVRASERACLDLSHIKRVQSVELSISSSSFPNHLQLCTASSTRIAMSVTSFLPK